MLDVGMNQLMNKYSAKLLVSVASEHSNLTFYFYRLFGAFSMFIFRFFVGVDRYSDLAH